MPDLQTLSTAGGLAGIAADDVALRLVAAAILGAAVAAVYRRSTSGPVSGSFPVTLVLLSVLIAMVAQVIGDNIALAFSLVGALSIVRFRTVVRDTRDTTFVIFSVVIGMAAGGAHWWVAGIGFAIVAATALFMAWRARQVAGDGASYLLRLRTGLGVDAEQLIEPLCGQFVARRQLASVSSGKLGVALDYSWELQLRPGQRIDELVRQLSLLEGVQEVRIERQLLEAP